MADQKDDDPPHAPPPPTTLHALEEQATPKLKQKARRFAQERVRLMRWLGIPVFNAYEQELVNDALVDTWSGALPWDPSRRSLLKHVRRAIRQRTRHEIRRGRRVSFGLHEPANDEVANDATTPELIVSADVERAVAEASHGRCSPSKVNVILTTTCQELRPQFSNDDQATGVVQCWEDGFVERSVVMNLTGLTGAAYERTLKRLFYAGRQLSPELREAAQDLLKNAA